MALNRVLTVAEALALPPPTEAELEERRRTFDEMSAITAQALARRGGAPIPSADLEWALDRDDEDIGSPK